MITYDAVCKNGDCEMKTVSRFEEISIWLSQPLSLVLGAWLICHAIGILLAILLLYCLWKFTTNFMATIQSFSDVTGFGIINKSGYLGA